MIFYIFALALLIIAYEIFACMRLMRLLHLLQQEDYRPNRFLKLLIECRGFDRKATLAIFLCWIIATLSAALGTGIIPTFFPIILLAAAIFLVLLAWFEPDPRRNAKKVLVLTARAKRILITACVAALIPASAALWFPAPPHNLILLLITIQLLPLILVGALALLSPQEQRVQRRYLREAAARLKQCNPVIIGVTGSYGKTSVKHILNSFLDTTAPTLMTPGSVNTPMGVSRILREQLTSSHRYFICEAGAYQRGSIARLCRLAPPQFAVVTHIGVAHYERFKSREAVAEAKSELIEAALAHPHGHVITSCQGLGFTAPRRLLEQAPERFTILSTPKHCATHLTSLPDNVKIVTLREIKQTRKGIALTLSYDDTDPITLTTPLFGAHQGYNTALAFTAAHVLGMLPDDIALAACTLPQIAHRLEIRHLDDGSTLIDDAYSANPEGFIAAIDVLDFLARDRGRRILITPGVVELGELHDQTHSELGKQAGSKVDILMPVAPEGRLDSLIEAFRKAAPEASIISCPTFNDADLWLRANRRSDDIVLIANDLPDLYERPLRF